MKQGRSNADTTSIRRYVSALGAIELLINHFVLPCVVLFHLNFSISMRKRTFRHTQLSTKHVTTEKQTTKFSSANFQKMLSPSYIIFRIQRMEGKQSRSR